MHWEIQDIETSERKHLFKNISMPLTTAVEAETRSKFPNTQQVFAFGIPFTVCSMFSRRAFLANGAV